MPLDEGGVRELLDGLEEVGSVAKIRLCRHRGGVGAFAGVHQDGHAQLGGQLHHGRLHIIFKELLVVHFDTRHTMLHDAPPDLIDGGLPERGIHEAEADEAVAELHRLNDDVVHIAHGLDGDAWLRDGVGDAEFADAQAIRRIEQLLGLFHVQWAVVGAAPDVVVGVYAIITLWNTIPFHKNSPLVVLGIIQLTKMYHNRTFFQGAYLPKQSEIRNWQLSNLWLLQEGSLNKWV